MRNLECPHCHKHKVPVFTKLFLGPGRAIACPECGGKMSVPASGIWVIIPAVVAAIAGMRMETTNMSIAVFCLGLAITGFLHCRYLPMVPR